MTEGSLYSSRAVIARKSCIGIETLFLVTVYFQQVGRRKAGWLIPPPPPPPHSAKTPLMDAKKWSHLRYSQKVQAHTYLCARTHRPPVCLVHMNILQQGVFSSPHINKLINKLLKRCWRVRTPDKIQSWEYRTLIFVGWSGGRSNKVTIWENTGTFSLTVLCLLVDLLSMSYN